MPGCRTVRSALRTGSGLRLISGSRNLPMSVLSESDLEKAGSVVERLAGGGGERGALLGDGRLVEHLLGFEHSFLRWLQYGVHAAQDKHGQDDVGVFAALEQVAEHVVGDAPDEGDDFVVSGLVHLGELGSGGGGGLRGTPGNQLMSVQLCRP